jgi:sigma-B regulation protein RsbU (phosphoserine phosphatase)
MLTIEKETLRLSVSKSSAAGAASQTTETSPEAFSIFGKRHIKVLSLLIILGSIVAIAYVDSVVSTVSLGFLYLFPLALSALLQPRRITLTLVVICVFLHDWFGPYEHSWGQVLSRNFISFAGFMIAALLISRLAEQQRRLSALVRRQRDELVNEIMLAAQVQKNLLPQRSPHIAGAALAGRMLPARKVAGDYYDFIELNDGWVGLVIADISGKGVPAGLLMPLVKATLRLEAPRLTESNEVVKSFNQILYDVTDDARYATLFYGKFDPTRRLLQYTNAGHLPGLLYKSQAKETVWLSKGGLVTGLFPAAEYESDTVLLEGGDILILYTDGLIEAENQQGEQYARERLQAVVASHPDDTAEEITNAICASVLDFTCTEKLADDLTLLILKVE